MKLKLIGKSSVKGEKPKPKKKRDGNREIEPLSVRRAASPSALVYLCTGWMYAVTLCACFVKSTARTKGWMRRD